MTDVPDNELTRDFADHQSEAAFAQLVQRHIHLVHSVALRFTGHAEDARDVTQAVFIILARKASSLRDRATLTGWLYETTRLTARQFLRTRARQFARDQEAHMQSHLNEPDTDGVWQQLAPQLEEAMSRLTENERALLALRFFENKTGEETAALLGIRADAAHKRTARAVEKLRGWFTQRGVTLTATVLTAAISANSVQAAPLGLAATVTAAALKGAVVSGSTLTLIKGALKVMAWTKMKTAIAVSAGAVLLGASVYQAQQVGKLRKQNLTLQQQQAPLAEQIQQLQTERDDAANRLAGLLAENSRLKSNPNQSELLKLRGEVTRLKNQPVNPSDSVLKTWSARVEKLKQKLSARPELGIPELALLGEEDWLAAVKNQKLDSESDLLWVASGLRGEAEQSLAERFSDAIHKYTEAKGQNAPADFSELKPFMDSQITDDMLTRWQIASGKNFSGFGDWVITQKSVVDEIRDMRVTVGPAGRGSTDFLSSSTKDAMAQVYNAYRGANGGSELSGSFNYSDLLPYATTPDQQSAVKKWIEKTSLSR